MSKPAGKCVFCGGSNLTRSHIWPEWAQKIVPATSTHFELNAGQFDTFVSTVPGPKPFTKKRPRSGSKRQPRNTCLDCNSGWMREIEEAAQPIVSQLMLGRATIIDVLSQRLLAAFLCLVSMRIEFGGQMRAIPREDHDRLRTAREPGPSCWVAISHYFDEEPHEYWYGYLGMRRARLSDPPPVGCENCNTQVTTVLAGKMCAHMFNSTVWDDFRGYEGVHLTQI